MCVVWVRVFTNHFHVLVYIDLCYVIVLPPHHQTNSRDNKKHMSDISPADRDRIVALARRQLRKGVSAGNVPDASFKGATIRLVDNQWLVRGVPWSEARHLSTMLTKPVPLPQTPTI